MRTAAFSAMAAALFAVGCKSEPVAPESSRTFALTATVNETGRCSATVMGRSYESTGKIRGDFPAKFIGTLKDRSYHGLGCIVDNPAGEGDLVIVFSGNTYQQPLAVGTYKLVTEIHDGSPPMSVNVSFRSSSIEAERLATFDGARGSVVVDSTATGGRRIRADVDVFLYHRETF